ncbi:MAG TPA: hypothetical protein ENK12_01715 [Gammaproteobacteria bacterium]|nr:hypothetical protein [Gammaproteobacteria bacterium]
MRKDAKDAKKFERKTNSRQDAKGAKKIICFLLPGAKRPGKQSQGFFFASLASSRPLRSKTAP